MTGLAPIPITATRVADAFERAGFGTITFPEPIKRVGDGTSITIILPRDIPIFRFTNRKRVVFDYLEWPKENVFIEHDMVDHWRYEIWVHDGDTMTLP